MMSHLLVAVTLWLLLVVSCELSVLGLAWSSWKLLWLASLVSLIFSIPAALSIGPFVWLLTGLQLAAAIAIRWQLRPLQSLLLFLAAAGIWIVVVPLQLLVVHWPPLLLLVPLAIVVANIAVLVGQRPGRPVSP